MPHEKILLVEDNPLNRELATDLLEIAGYVVVHAATAEEALTLVTVAAPDLVLMDIALPGMDGLTATQILKQDAATSGIPVVALTAQAMKGDEEKARAAGCDGYISKPIHTKTFAQTVASFIAAGRHT